jgi:hypothetical protein
MILMNGATHVLQWARQCFARPQGLANSKTCPQFGSETATRLCEVGFGSNLKVVR